MAFFGDGFAGDLDGLPGADVQAAETGGAGGADGGVVAAFMERRRPADRNHADVRYGAGRYAQAAALGLQLAEVIVHAGLEGDVVGVLMVQVGLDAAHDLLHRAGNAHGLIQLGALGIAKGREDVGHVGAVGDAVVGRRAEAVADERFVALRGTLCQLGVAFNLDAPPLVVRQVPVKFIKIEDSKGINQLFDFINSLHMPYTVKRKASVGEHKITSISLLYHKVCEKSIAFSKKVK